MNGTVTEKAFEKMTTAEKMWLLYNTMVTREERYKKHFRRIYILIGALLITIVISDGGKSFSAALKIVGIF